MEHGSESGASIVCTQSKGVEIQCAAQKRCSMMKGFRQRIQGQLRNPNGQPRQTSTKPNQRQKRAVRRTRIAPTPAGWCAIAIASIALGIPRPGGETADPRPFVGVVLLLALFGELAMLLADRKRFTASVAVPAVLRCEEEGTVHVAVPNALPNQRIRYLSAHQLNDAGQASFNVQPRQRGIYRLRDLYLEDTGPIGLLRRSRIIDTANDNMVCVGPTRQTLGSETSINQNVASPSIDTELDRLRAYVSGDDVRLLNWRSTARVGQPMVEVHQPQATALVVVIDLGPNDGSKAEAWASLSAGALERMLDQGPIEVRSRDAQGEMTRTVTTDRQIDIVLGSAVTGEPVTLDKANLYIGAWRNDLDEARSRGVHIISDTTTDRL
jgi:Protein of unknown function DUF58